MLSPLGIDQIGLNWVNKYHYVILPLYDHIIIACDLFGHTSFSRFIYLTVELYHASKHIAAVVTFEAGASSSFRDGGWSMGDQPKMYMWPYDAAKMTYRLERVALSLLDCHRCKQHDRATMKPWTSKDQTKTLTRDSKSTN